MSVSEKLPGISFVIPTYNAGFHIERCLKSIRAQEYPKELLEILVLDGGSDDSTVSIATKFDCRILKNEKKLAEFGVQLGIGQANGDLLVVFAADNELVGNDWAKKVSALFTEDQGLCALWGRLASGKDDSKLNKYFELIQSDPLNWFLNNNLARYKKECPSPRGSIFRFQVNPRQPLVWGANGLVYRASKIKHIWGQAGYLGDNDAFQLMLEEGNNSVAYFDSPFVYHHHVARLGDWARKWRRNFSQHLLSRQETRNMNWVFAGNFKIKLFFWVFYSAIPLISLAHSIYLSIRDKSIYWFYHPMASFLQLFTYINLIIFDKSGRSFIKRIIFSDKKTGGGI
ncbi:MAG: glycosyltransferase family 2 protein [Candidatus Omnitrophica bacterium]|nr:glycosyltransferase family 2 protein [Candidatus Omnitrophota bacterium]